jgi:dihydropteroate synthase
MGIVNRTPDSFFDGGRYLDDDAGRSRVDALVRAGADVVDFGAESTRPGAAPIDAETQIFRLGDSIAYAVSLGLTVSVDTTLPAVAEHALRLGARMLNSVSLAPAATFGALAARFDADLVLTHCRGSMTDMRGFSTYDANGYGDIVDDVVAEWTQAAHLALGAGLPPERLWFDPGLGFTKNATQSLELCVRLTELKARLGHPILVGPSRKSYVALSVTEGGTPAGPIERLGGSLAAVLDCAARGVEMVRVHDVAETVQALAYQRAVSAASKRMAATRSPNHEHGGGAACSTA